MNFSTAVPVLVNCLVPRRWMSVQCAADASQKFTCPVVTAVVPVFTVAVSVTTLLDATVVTVLPPDATARVVVVAAGAAQARTVPPQRAITETAETHNDRQSLLTFTDNLHSCFPSIMLLAFHGLAVSHKG
jgi:hypothetical protein